MPTPSQRPNILYLHSHDTGRWTEPYGYDVPMPNYRKVAEQGTLFRQAYSAAPTCSASRAALLTGCSSHSAGMLGLAHRGFHLSDPSRHLLHTLKAAGYFTALAGLQHVFSPKELSEAGYDFLRNGKQPAEKTAAEFLRTASPARPFFLDVGFFETHRSGTNKGFDNEKHGEGPPDGRYTSPPAPLPDTLTTRRDAGDFRICAARLDRKIGIVLDALEKSGHAENTIVILTTDHGPAFPAMKCNLTDHGIGILLMLRGPRIPSGVVKDSLISQIDLFPTLCDWLGIAKPNWLEGKSFAPILAGQADKVNDEIFAEVTYHAAYEPMRAVRTQRWKYIRRWGGRNRPVLPNCDDSPSKDEWVAKGWGDRPVAAEELYDLCFDPQEHANQASDPTYANTLSEMRTRLDRWMKRTNDPLYGRKSVPAPSGALVNDPNGISPSEKPRRIP